MQIIKDNSWHEKRACTGCDSHLSLDADDVHFQAYTDLRLYGFICAACGWGNRLKEEDLPDYVKRKANKYDGRVVGDW